jgi:2-dehydropantoate 2-reductase
MLQDALAHRRTEIDALNGGIVRFGAQTGVPTPLNEAIVALIGGMEHAWSSQPRAQSE